jgi:hypothetical protein
MSRMLFDDLVSAQVWESVKAFQAAMDRAEAARLADEDYCANHCQAECRPGEACSLVGGCPLERNPEC